MKKQNNTKNNVVLISLYIYEIIDLPKADQYEITMAG